MKTFEIFLILAAIFLPLVPPTLCYILWRLRSLEADVEALQLRASNGRTSAPERAESAPQRTIPKTGTRTEPPAPPVAKATVAPSRDFSAPPYARVRPKTAAVEAPAPTPAKTAHALERNVGTRLFVWLGGLALIFAGFFLVKYTVEHGVLTPTARLCAAGAFAAALLGCAEYFRRKTRGARIAGVLAGAAVAVAYGDCYAAVFIYELIPPVAAFFGAVFCALVAVALSPRFGRGLGMMALLGGFIAPVILLLGSENPWHFFAYLFLLTVASLWISARQQYRIAPWVAYAFNLAWVLFWVFSKNPEIATSVDIQCLSIFCAATAAVFMLAANRLNRPSQSGNGTVLLALVPAASALCFTWAWGALNNAVAIDCAFAVFALLFIYGRLTDVSEHSFYWGIFSGLLTLFVASCVGLQSYDALCVALGIPALFACRSLFFRDAPFENAILLISIFFSAAVYLLFPQNGAIGFGEVFAWAVPVFFGIVLTFFFGRFRTPQASPNFADARTILWWGAWGLATLYLCFFKNTDIAVALFGLSAAAALGTAVYLREKQLPTVLGLLGCALFILALCQWLLAPHPFVPDGGAQVGFSRALWWGIACVALFSAREFAVRRGSPFTWHPLHSLLLCTLAFITFRWFWLAGGAWLGMSNYLDVFTYGLYGLFFFGLGAIFLGAGISEENGGSCAVGAATLLYASLILLRFATQSFGDATFEGAHSIAAIFLLWGVPALLFALSARYLRAQTARGVAISLAALFLFIFLNVTLRAVFHTHAEDCVTSMGEWVSYSLLWLAYGAGLLWYGVRHACGALRIASLVCVLLAVAKAFLFDAAELGGLWRVASFLLLGVSLIGIGYFYSKVVFKNPPRADAPAR